MIVGDASWIIALRDPDDAQHLDATRINTALGDETVLLHPVTFAECLVGPAKLGALEHAAADLQAAVEVTDIGVHDPLRWASLRAATNLRLPDAIVLDTAIHNGARRIATFDRRLAMAAQARRIPPLTSRR